MATEKKPTKKPSKAKTTEALAEEKIEFVAYKTYVVEALSTAKVLTPEKQYKVTGAIAEELYRKGWVKVVK